MRIEPAVEPGRHNVTFTWQETDPGRAAHAVLVRLVAETDYAHDDGDLSGYLMSPQGDGLWAFTLALPSNLRSAYQICPIRDEPLNGHPSPERWMAIVGMGVRDVNNPLIHPAGVTYGNASDASVLELPEALPQPWRARRADVPRGTMTRHEIEAADREPAVVHVYLPSEYQENAAPLPLVILFDAKWWMSLDVADTFDNLIADGAVRPMIVAAIESMHGAARWHALTHQDVFEPFLMDELLPWIQARWKASDDPADTVLAGQSLGGIVASHLARHHSGRFGWVIGHSMALWWPGDDEGGLTGQQVIDSYVSGEPAPVRFFLDVGSRERDLLKSVRVMRDTLAQQNYAVRYREYEGGHDFSCWRGGLADGLIAALGR